MSIHIIALLPVWKSFMNAKWKSKANVVGVKLVSGLGYFISNFYRLCVTKQLLFTAYLLWKNERRVPTLRAKNISEKRRSTDNTSLSAKEIAKTKGLAKETPRKKDGKKKSFQLFIKVFCLRLFRKQNKNKITFATLFYAISFHIKLLSIAGFELRVKVRSRCLNLNYKCLCTRL